MLVERIEQRPHTRSNGHDVSETMQGSTHLDKALPWPIRVREWFRRMLYRQGWEHVVVNKQVDSITMPRWVASAILVAILGFGVQSWWARSADHDTMIRIETRLEAMRDAANKVELEQKATNSDMQAWREVMNGNQKQIIGMLSQQQLDALQQLKKSQQQDQ